MFTGHKLTWRPAATGQCLTQTHLQQRMPQENRQASSVRAYLGEDGQLGSLVPAPFELRLVVSNRLSQCMDVVILQMHPATMLSEMLQS